MSVVYLYDIDACEIAGRHTALERRLLRHIPMTEPVPYADWFAVTNIADLCWGFKVIATASQRDILLERIVAHAEYPSLSECGLPAAFDAFFQRKIVTEEWLRAAMLEVLSGP